MQKLTSGAFEVLLQIQTQQARFETISRRVSKPVRYRLFRRLDFARITGTQSERVSDFSELQSNVSAALKSLPCE